VTSVNERWWPGGGLGVVILMVALAAGCSGSGPGTTIDLLDVVHLGGRDYFNLALIPSDCAGPGGPGPTPAELGPVVASTRINLARTAKADHHLVDGDAGQLPAGTKLFALTGVSPHFRLAAYKAGRLTIYEAVDNPAATRGSDLLDLSGVESIGVSGPDHNLLGDIQEPSQVAQAVEMVLQAPVDDHAMRAATDTHYCVTFRLRDTPWVGRPYFPASGTLGLAQALDMPAAFRAAIEAATGR